MKRGRPMKRGKPLAQRSAKMIASEAQYQAARRERIALARGQCEAPAEFCRGSQHSGAHAHHVRRRSQGGGHDVENLRWLCFDAHDYVHAHPTEAAAVGLLVMR